ncbi:twin arginine translocase protein A [Corynebacterium ciconiae DSM 44920]|uniref:Sec-independent protein translocase subunit TatA n=1 Tax=Corynebacterium ciconiae TaxID=227319 RepID=UPI00036DF888|nr:Sec-independent protein translocase subunit TatA [Corynebacterium ciconiae]WKD61179.1 twin arginine translocase protein A [Corynebacterium ciconiae DSM 44920]
MPTLGFWEIALVVLVIILLFGAKRLPDAARSLGRSMRIFKSEVKEMSNDDNPQPAPQVQQQLPQQPQQMQQPQQPVQQPVQQPNPAAQQYPTQQQYPNQQG